jgi:hypothetical protein
MSMIHAPGVHDALRRRIESLRPDSQRKWGRMTVDQMLWHVNVSMSECLGEYSPAPMRVPMPRKLLRWLLLNVPWPKSARTRPDMVAAQRYDFETERARCLRLLDGIHRRDLSASWSDSASLGEMSGKHWSRLQAKHLEHHLKQFGV